MIDFPISDEFLSTIEDIFSIGRCWIAVSKLPCSAWENCSRYRLCTFWYKRTEFRKNKEIYIGISHFGNDNNRCGTNCKNNSSVEYALSTTTNTFRIVKDSIVLSIFFIAYSYVYSFIYLLPCFPKKKSGYWIGKNGGRAASKRLPLLYG